MRRPVRLKLTGEIIAALRDDILSGRVPPGARLPTERELARQFGVSQPSVREATRALEATGLIEVRHGSGAYVTGDPTEIISTALQAILPMQRIGMTDVIGLRTALARYSVERAVHRATTEDIERIHTCEEALLNLHDADLERSAELAVAFMVSITAAAHHPLLYAIDTFLIRLLVQIHQLAFVDEPLEAWHEWSLSFAPIRRRLVAALTARDEEAAIDAMIAYLELQGERFAARGAGELRLDAQTMRKLAALPNTAGG
jgi:GntR family transcriptional repressor for pyruvate dehydrogenase complex